MDSFEDCGSIKKGKKEKETNYNIKNKNNNICYNNDNNQKRESATSK